MSAQNHDSAISENSADTVDVVRPEAALLKTGALQSAIFNSANFSSIATGEKGVIYGDRSMLRQVFVNLLSNEVKYTRDRREARIEIGCAGTIEEETTTFVRDNGAGFEMEYVNKLFRVFQRPHGNDFGRNAVWIGYLPPHRSSAPAARRGLRARG